MLELRRLRLLRELHRRGTIAAVADALAFTPSAVSQQLGMLEREAGTRLLERVGRGVRLTDAGLLLVDHADALLDRAERAEADLAAAAGAVAGRARIAGFQSVLVHLVMPAIAALAEQAPRLRCELVEAEPEEALPALAVGDLDIVIGDEWQHAPRRLPGGVVRRDLLSDRVFVVVPADHEIARHREKTVALSELAGEVWVSGHVALGWEEMVQRTCREVGGFDPDIRHGANDANIALELVSRGLAVTLLPELPLLLRHQKVAVRQIAGHTVSRTIFAATRAVDEHRPSTNAGLATIEAVVDALDHEPVG
jgi:DNA-binding transcriptional LysR family regulator